MSEYNDLSISRARTYWLSNNLDSYDFVLLLSADDAAINVRFHTVFEQKLNGRRGAVIEGEAAQELLQLYEMYEFSSKIIIGSFDAPYGRKLRNLIACRVANEDVLINDVILGAL